MVGKSENFSELNRKNMEAAMRLAQLSIENSQRVMALQSELARDLFQQGVENAKAQTTAKDPQEVLRLRNVYAQETAQKMMQAAQKVAEIGNDARTEFSHMLTEQLASGSQEMIDAFQGFFKTMPGQNANVMEVMQQAVATAKGAFEQMSQAFNGCLRQHGEHGAKKRRPQEVSAAGQAQVLLPCQRRAASMSVSRASTQRPPEGVLWVSSFFQNGAWVFR